MNLTDYMPHAICLLNQPLLITIHVACDLSIFVAYMVISTLLFTIRRNGKLISSFRDFLSTRADNLTMTSDIPQWWFASFATFIAVCGFTHLMDVIVLWYPIYWAQALVKFITALASVSTAYFLVRVVAAYAGHMRRFKEGSNG